MRRILCSVMFAFLLSGAGLAGQPFWPQFRGPLGQGVAPSGDPPVRFSPSDARWATPVPQGHSSPVVWGGRIFLTACEDGRLFCQAYDRQTGKRLWSRAVPTAELEPTHSFGSPAAPTPVVDQERVIFYLGSYGLLAFSHEGDPSWELKLPPQVSRGKYGSASSPVLCGDLVVLALDTDNGASRLLALKRVDGTICWETPRPLFSAGWSTPVLWRQGEQSQLVVLGSKMLVSYEPATGKQLWSLPGFTVETSASPAFEDQTLYACAAGLGGRESLHFQVPGWQQLIRFDANGDSRIQTAEVPADFKIVLRPELPEGHPGRLLPFAILDMLRGRDENRDGEVTEGEWGKFEQKFEASDAPVLMAIRPGEMPVNQERLLWKHARGIPEVPSPLAFNGRLYLVRDGGILQSLEGSSGRILYQERLGVSGGYTASPVAAAGRIYFASQSGTITVVNAETESLDILARNVFGEKITATPALVDSFIYVRTDRNLYAFTRVP